MVISALHFCRSTYEVLNDRLPKFFNFPVESQLELFTISRDWTPVQFVKNAKYFTAWPLARYNGQGDELPAPDDFVGPNRKYHPLIFKGQLRKFLKNRLVSHNKTNLGLWGSFLQGIKRGCYTVPEEFIQVSYEKHRKQMLEEPETSCYQIQSKFTSKVKECLSDARPIENYRLYEASTSACFEKKRDEGGGREAVREFIDEINSYTDLDEVFKYYNIEEEDKRRFINSATLSAQLRYRYVLDVAPAVYDLIDDQNNLNVMVHGICEPLKVRIITKGEAVPYWIARHMQKYMWNYLQDYPQFSATGRPLEVSDIYMIEYRRKALENRMSIDLGFDQYVSGDYSAATDGVNIHMTMLVFNEFCERAQLPDHIRRIITGVIGPQMVHYPPKSGLEPVLQRNGQLMGSVLSFPILCIINVVAYWMAMDEYISTLVEEDFHLKLEELPVMVNGDDILFPANDEFYEYWKKNIAIVGFKLSLGKNYISKEFLTINSIIFRINHDPKTGNLSFDEVPTYNVGLLTGQSKHTARSETRTLPIWEFYNEVIKGSARPDNARRRFFHYNQKWISECTGRGLFNCFLPHELGGLGFSTEGLDLKTIHVTYFQRLWADYTLHKMEVDAWDLDDTRIGIVRINRNHKSSVKSGTLTRHDRRKLKESLNSIYQQDSDLYGPNLPFVSSLREFIHEDETNLPILWSDIDYENKPEMVVSIPWKTVEAVKKYHAPQRSGFINLLTYKPKRFMVRRPINDSTSLYYRSWVTLLDNGV